MKLLFLGLFLNSLAWSSYDRCPGTMILQGKDCVYKAGNLTDPTYDCNNLKGKFGFLDCSNSTGKLCEDWAVMTCKEIVKTCIPLGGVNILKKYKGKQLKQAKATLNYCKDSSFTIIDPGPDSKPKNENLMEPPTEEKADLQGYDFHGALILQEAVRKQQELLSAVNNPAEVLVCPVEFLDALPEKYKRCLERKDLENTDWLTYKSYPLPLGSSNTRYRIRKRNGSFEIAINFLLTYKGDEKDRDEVVTKITNARQCVERFFRRHRINLNLGLSHDQKSWINWWNADITNVTISRQVPTFNSSSWALAMQNDNNEYFDLSEQALCGTLAHEISHRLGLPDRYLAENFTTDSNALMQSGNWNLPAAYFTEEDLKILTDPLCRYNTFPSQIVPVPSSHPTPLP